MTQYAVDGRFLPALYNGITEGLLKKAEEELKETEESKRDGLSRLREFIKKEGLPEELSDDFLLCFLRVAKYDEKKSEDRLRNYCNTTKKRKEYIERLDEDKVNYIMDSKIMGILPYRDMHGRLLYYARPFPWDPEECELADLFAFAYCLVLYGLSLPATSISGIGCLVDGRVNHTSHYFSILTCWKANLSNLISLPLRFQKVDVMHVNYFIHIFYAAIRPIVPKKLTKRVALHKDTFTDTICDPSILPEEFDGTMGPASNDFIKEKFLAFLKGLKRENSMF